MAIKRLANPFMNELEARRTLREIKVVLIKYLEHMLICLSIWQLLKYFKHENVLRVPHSKLD